MTELFAAAVDRDRLEQAWEYIEQRDEHRDVQSEAVARFAQSSADRLDAIHVELVGGTYQPLPLTRVAIPKSDGSERLLAIPAVRDRVVERSVLSVVGGYADRYLGVASYAYREGIGVVDAVEAVARLRDEGLGWVLHADIDNCFDTIPRQSAVRALLAMLPDSSLDALIRALSERPVATGRGLIETSGVSQGAALSPLLANIVLVALDDALMDHGFPVVRYADDFVVAGRSRDAMWEAKRVATAALEGIGMQLGDDKTEVMSFDDGFCFLGEDFGPRYPPVTDQHRVEVPDRRILYVGRQGSRIFTQRGRVVVESKSDEQLVSVPKNLVSRVVCFGAVTVAAGTRSWALEEGIDVVFLSRRGQYLGQHLPAAREPRVSRLRAQIAASADPVVTLPLAREMVDTKIAHQITVLQRFAREEHVEIVDAALATMRRMRMMLPEALTRDEVLGLEGAAAAAYFPAYGALMPVDLRFERRSRRPPLDVANSALGYGYALLLGESVGALAAAGLHPGLGVLHADSDRRPGLGLDLMEELRPMVIDQVVLAAARRGALLPAHGAPAVGEAGVHLTKAGKEALVTAYEQRMQQVTAGAIPGFRGSIRRHLYRQAKRLAKSILTGETHWTGMSWR
ncbi:CRISPR-associated endonuclease Cas1 [Millisia brevis]|uniref:CRISPR-associated endonuclease Cas1 n=1 Tax=Millisia brevis TaxID=264148 RepID=UPI00082A50A0|nr:CRISPR-associated endonuclease Cas1 [Millisia brevis]